VDVITCAIAAWLADWLTPFRKLCRVHFVLSIFRIALAMEEKKGKQMKCGSFKVDRELIG
jgi:hypothetical protein